MERLSVNMSEEDMEFIKDYGARHGLNVTEVVRRMKRLLVVVDQTEQDGSIILIRKDDETRQIIFL